VVKCLGIFRELQNSPNRETDDALILKAVIDQLELQRVEARAAEPEKADQDDLSGWDMIVPMCETYPRLMRLRKLADEGKALIVNHPDAVLGCYRTRMIPSFEASGVLFPETLILPTASAGKAELPDWASKGVWLKRGDVHNTCTHDVVFARDAKEFEAVRADFERREISNLLVQRHVEGDLIKFYGVGPGQWFTWFYHDPASARRLSFELEDLAQEAEKAAGAIGLEIFGGDAIISPDGPIYIIDINSWPSFAKVRTDAAIQIARRLRARLRQRESAKKR
jgi:glutathione synthase/RimK-type ligase-like ATP-grasp enzyme